ncbi:MAG TPA: HlyD family efflux transporter periplasmic adaptor subunit [Burkholderiales bacterium]|nr:HlyD family efflux transporter periplasmic adaptor subunit [Burkholderiales bacterium]
MSAQPPASANGKRKTALAIILLLFAAGGIAWGVWWWLAGQWVETTDDAYVGGNVVQVTPQAAGTVIAVRADDTDFVKAGDELVRLDQADAKVALEQAEANLARAVRQVRALYATDGQLGATVTQRETELARVKQDLARREQASADGAVSREEIEHARDAVAASEAALAAAREQLVASRALTDGTTVAAHPDVAAAAAKVHEAFISYARTVMPAPVSGFVAKRSVQVGQRVSAGTPMMAVVPLDQVWVDANFKESQLADVRVGQTATVISDLYGNHVEYRGRVAGFGAGTGAAFALLPAQNATGNWIKVVQRVPVRVVLDPKEVAAHPLQIGLSLRVAIETRDRSGQRLPQAERAPAVQETNVFEAPESKAAERIARIIQENGGGKPRS